MKKILFVVNNLQIGGIQRSLIELLQVLDGEFDVTLYCINYNGSYIKRVPSSVRIIEGNLYAINPELTKEECRGRGIISYMLHFFIKIWSKCFGRRIPAWVICQLSGCIDGKYDYAISYAQPSNSHYCISLTNEMVIYKSDAKEKITFVHCDYGLYGGDTKYNRWLYKRFDKVAAVSNSVKRRFVEIMPYMEKRTTVVPNACNVEQIRMMANDNPVDYKKISLVSLSRLGPEKGLLRCVKIFRKLADEGFAFEWHIVGDGQERKKMEQTIAINNMQGYIFLEGMQDNPYRYLKNANCLFMPSFHEAAPMVFNEAACLGIPILSTNTLSAKELVEDRHLGAVCENNDESIYCLLKSYLEDINSIYTNGLLNFNSEVLASFNNLCDL